MEKVDLFPWEACSFSNKVPCLLSLEKGQAIRDGAQASKEEPDCRVGMIEKIDTNGVQCWLEFGELWMDV